jgi:small subunit ribosomal protein S21
MQFMVDDLGDPHTIAAPLPHSNTSIMSNHLREVQVRKGEPVDRALKRLKTKLEMEGVYEEMRRLRSHETPVQRTKRKARAAAKRGKIRFRFTNKPPVAPESAEAPVA